MTFDDLVEKVGEWERRNRVNDCFGDLIDRLHDEVKAVDGIEHGIPSGDSSIRLREAVVACLITTIRMCLYLDMDSASDIDEFWARLQDRTAEEDKKRIAELEAVVKESLTADPAP